MTDLSPAIRYAAVVPSASLWHAPRVPEPIRRLLRVDVYEVGDDGQVHQR